MRIRTRKFLGTIALLVLVVVWSLLGMAVAQMPWLAASGLYRGDLLCCRRTRLGLAGYADRELDGETRRVKRLTVTSPAASASLRPGLRSVAFDANAFGNRLLVARI